jgi:hypothetical protein
MLASCQARRPFQNKVRRDGSPRFPGPAAHGPSGAHHLGELAPQLGLSAPAAAERVRRPSFPGVPKQGAGVEFHAINGSNANGYDLGTDVHIYGTLRTLTTTPVPVPACF